MHSNEDGMNYGVERKFSFQEDDNTEPTLDDPSAPSAPPSSFSFQAIANKVSSTISAPTSPARSSESLAAALERSLHHDRSRAAPAMHPDARVVLVIDNHVVDWSKYFRNPADPPIRIEQANFTELDLMCTEHSLIVEINQPGKDSRTFCPQAAFVGPGATWNTQAKTILRALIVSGVPFVNSHTSMIAFLDKSNLKKQLRKIVLADGSRIPMLPSIHYPHFHKFHPSTSFPVVISVNQGFQGIGKIKVNSHEELCDVEGMLQIMSKGDTEKLSNIIYLFIYIQFLMDLLLAFFGESQEDDRRATAWLLRALLAAPKMTPRLSVESPKEARIIHGPTRGHSVDRQHIEQREQKETKEQHSTQSSFADDTMGQLKRTFAGIFGDVS
uniref:Synapsin domain-containing protein n=1 Tax=Heterorhabditis bacteriophora TaxID=37862 RepID=A0A1I7X769_HETBA